MLDEIRIAVNPKDLSFFNKFQYTVESHKVTFSVFIYQWQNNKQNIALNTEGHNKYMWEQPEKLLKRKDLMVGLYPILRRYLKAPK